MNKVSLSFPKFLILGIVCVFSVFAGASFASAQTVQNASANTCELHFYSDTTDQISGWGGAVPTYSGHPDWTANIPGATWIWKTFFVENPTQEETVDFSKAVY